MVKNMQELIGILNEIDKYYYRGVYTLGEFYDLKKGLTELLTNKKFI